MSRFLVVPQWQGSPAARAMLLVDGAAAITGDLPRRDTRTLDVPLEAGESLGTGIRRFSSLRRVRDEVAEHLPATGEHPVVIGGDCGVTVAALAAVDTSGLAVLWCDAHPDLHDPASSPSGAFSGMALRAVMGQGGHDLVLQPGIPAERVVSLGARAVDPGEVDVLAGVRHLTVAQSTPDAVTAVIRATGVSRVWVHIDVDVIDPAEMEGVSDPAPFGISAVALAEVIRAVRAEFPLAGATIAGFAPRSPADAVQDLGAILRLIGALA